MKKKPVNDTSNAASEKLEVPKGMGRPLFTSYIYPCAPAKTEAKTELSGGGAGSVTGLGARGSETPWFIVDTYPYVPPDANNGTSTPGSEE